MILRVSGTCRPSLLLAAAIGGLVMAVGLANGSFGASADLMFGREPVARAAVSLPAHDASLDRVDLHDGLSPVPARWKENFERFAQDDRVRPLAQGGVVFVGSSSIDYWSDLQGQFPTHDVVQRGIPGATMADCMRHADRLVLPLRPSVVVVYAGDNDLAFGVTPDSIVADYAALVRHVHRELPAARLVFLSIKPSPSRTALMPLIRKTNALMAAYADTDRQLDFVDVFSAMLDRDAHARRELFRADGLHMNPAGYALWHDALVERLN